MIEFLTDIDIKLFLFLNSLHADWLDTVMWHISGKLQWIPLYLIFAGMIIRQFRWQSVWIFSGIGLTILLSDQLASGIMKPFFERLRPSHDPGLAGIVHLVNDYKGGKYGFASSHAANAFGLATFLWQVFREKYARFLWIFLWASVVAYSRIYLGVHYPGDVLTGAFIGIGFGYGCALLSQYAHHQWRVYR